MKKFNQIIEDMPFIIKLILGIMLCIISAAIMCFINIAKVKAATIDYTATDIYVLEKNIISQTETYQRYNNNQSTGSYLTSVVKQINIQFNNFQSGSATSIITLDLNGFNTNNLNCSDAIARVEWKQGLTHNNIPSTVNRNGWSCNNGRIQVQYNSQMNVTSGDYIELQIELSNWTTITNEIIANGTMSVNSSQNASNGDITNQTTQIITNAIQNALDIITNENNNTNAIAQMISDLTNSITGKVQTAIENTNLICEDFKIQPVEIKIQNKYLNNQGLEGTPNPANSYGISDYIRIKENTPYIIKQSAANMNSPAFCFYKEDKTIIICESYGGRTNITGTTPNNTAFIRMSIMTLYNTIVTLEGTKCVTREEWQNEQDDRRISSVIAEMVQNATDQIQSTVDNSTDIINQINSSATNIINQMQEKVKNALMGTNNICNNETLDLSDRISNWNIALDLNGNIINRTESSVTRFIKLNKGNYYTYKRNFIGGNINYCLYDSTKTLIQCYEIDSDDDTVTLYNNNEDLYVRFTVSRPVNGNITQTLSGLFCSTVAEIQAQAIDEIRETTDTIVNTIRQTDTSCMHLNWKMLSDYDRQSAFLNTSGQYVSNNKYNVYGKYPIQKSIYHLKYNNKYNYVNNASYCLYDINQDLISCQNISSNTSEFIIDNSNQDYYFISVSVPNHGDEYDVDGLANNTTAILWTDYCATTPGINAAVGDISIFQRQKQWTIYDEEATKDGYGLQAIWNKLKDIGTGMTNIFNSFVSDPSSTLSNLNSDFASNNTISSLLLLPVSMLQAFYNGFNDVCSDFSVGTLYGTNLKYSCINLRAILGDTIWSFYDIVITGIFILVIRKKMVDIFYKIFSLSLERNELE